MRERASLASCNTVVISGTPQLRQRRVTKYAWFHFIGLLAPSVVAVASWNLDAGPELMRKENQGTVRILWVPDPSRDTEGCGQSRLTRALRPLRSEARPGHVTQTLQHNTLTGRDCCFSNHYSYNYIPSD